MSVSYDGLQFDRPGHASVRIETDRGMVIYIDPWSEVIESAPNDGDIVFVTHDDFDHYDPDAIAAVAKPEATVAVYEAIDTSDLAFTPVQLPYEGNTTVNDVIVETYPAYNDRNGPHVDENGDPFHADGEVIGLLLLIEDTSVFFPSDTDFLSHHEMVSASVFIPPIGGHYTMDRHEAAEFARSVHPELVLPVHYDTFDSIKTDAQAFVDDLAADGIRVELF